MEMLPDSYKEQNLQNRVIMVMALGLNHDHNTAQLVIIMLSSAQLIAHASIT